eukprot:4086427-Karenia_brevis.AAC.1
MQPTLEKANLLQPSPDFPGQERRRPADVFLPSAGWGQPAALDFAITGATRQDFLQAATLKAGAAAAAYAHFKR